MTLIICVYDQISIAVIFYASEGNAAYLDYCFTLVQSGGIDDVIRDKIYADPDCIDTSQSAFQVRYDLITCIGGYLILRVFIRNTNGFDNHHPVF